MQEALPYKRWEALPRMSEPSASRKTHVGGGGGNDDEIITMLPKIVKAVKENPVIVIGKRGCCMCHVVKKLLLGLGVNPPLFEIDGEVNDITLLNSLCKVLVNEDTKVVNVGSLQFPMVFVGGKLFGGLDRVMATHLSGDLVPILKQARALWL